MVRGSELIKELMRRYAKAGLIGARVYNLRVRVISVSINVEQWQRREVGALRSTAARSNSAGILLIAGLRRRRLVEVSTRQLSLVDTNSLESYPVVGLVHRLVPGFSWLSY